MAEMTDNEIIKALECCISNSDCSACVFLGSGVGSKTTCEVKMIKSALALINRKNAEIERLKNLKNFERFTDTEKEVFREQIGKLFDVVRAEAVKEFAKRLKDYYIKNKRYDRPYAHTMISLLFGLIDDIVKEMAGEEN